MKTQERIRLLEHVKYYIKADLTSGFRQFGTHPADWRLQVYCNGPDEHYIDLACPFGKTNSPKEFCPPVALFAKSAAYRYGEFFNRDAPNLGSYMDDIIGGFPNCESYQTACHLRTWLCETGKKLTIVFNLKKTPMPTREQVMLGCLNNSIDKHVMSSPKKVEKYSQKIDNILKSSTVKVRDVESLHGNLTYAASVAPFARPFLVPFTNTIIGRQRHQTVRVSAALRSSLII